jgi:predicted DCC family thiol-disulfide oxidoreductase YuxK
MTDGSPILLFDGTCGFCARSVQFVLRHEGKRRTLRFASLQSGAGTDVRRRHPELEHLDSVVWVEPSDAAHESVYVRSRAVLRVLRYLGGGWPVLAWVGAIVPRFVRDWMYDVVAGHRHQLTRDGPACFIPDPDQRARFID